MKKLMIVVFVFAVLFVWGALFWAFAQNIYPEFRTVFGVILCFSVAIGLASLFKWIWQGFMGFMEKYFSWTIGLSIFLFLGILLAIFISAISISVSEKETIQPKSIVEWFDNGKCRVLMTNGDIYINPPVSCKALEAKLPASTSQP